VNTSKQPFVRTGRLFILIVFTVLWYALIQGISQAVFAVSPETAAMPRDLAAHLLLAALCYGLSAGRLTLALPAVAALVAALNLCNAGKIAFYGTPVMPDDFLALRNLFMLLTGWQLAGAVAIVVLPITLLLVMISWRRWQTWFLLAGMTLAIAAVMLKPEPVLKVMDTAFKNSVWNQRGNFESRGVLIHIVQEAIRHQARSASPPTEKEVEEALAVLQSVKPGRESAVSPQGAGKQARNVHMIVLESFWDAALMTGSGLSEDPLDPGFRKLWQASGNSHALSPVFGGYTANPEFEILCGLPVTENFVFFEAGLRNTVACLPQVLSTAGYRSIASHPNVAGFWNRVNAYLRIGFDTYWSERDFLHDDLNGEFLSDASLYRQVKAKVDPVVAGGTPVFNYILTYFGHVDYPLNAQRPKVITTTDKNVLLNNYVNLMHYKSRELMDFLGKLRQDDPDSLIVLFGDHLPFLGPGFYGYLRSELLTDNRATMTDPMVYTLTATPLVVIDGRRGPVPLGDVPMYRLPALILDLLGLEGGPVVRLSATPGDAVIRPLPGMYWIGENGGQKVCREDRKQQECAETDRWLRAIITVTRDLFSGRQHSLPAIEQAETGSIQ
jgi:phosphoglycerol transferase MdoB-like AlkP superfamily enzyme